MYSYLKLSLPRILSTHFSQPVYFHMLLHYYNPATRIVSSTDQLMREHPHISTGCDNLKQIIHQRRNMPDY